MPAPPSPGYSNSGIALRARSLAANHQEQKNREVKIRKNQQPSGWVAFSFGEKSHVKRRNHCRYQGMRREDGAATEVLRVYESVSGHQDGDDPEICRDVHAGAA